MSMLFPSANAISDGTWESMLLKKEKAYLAEWVFYIIMFDTTFLQGADM
jgi:hypothetical protein